MMGGSEHSASVRAIWIKRAHREAMNPVPEAQLIARKGIAGNVNSGGRRQVTLIDGAAWRAACAEVGDMVDPSLRRANVLLEGIDLEATRGRILRIGPVLLRILGETRPCERMDEARPGLRSALESHWRGGAFGEVLSGGTIHVGDAAAWEDDAPD